MPSFIPNESTFTPTLSLPLCVDLDGTLIKSDTLVDSVLVLARQHPRLLLSIPGWILKGKASFKQHVTNTISLDVSALPYNKPLLEFLFNQHAQGRAIYLATAADRALADRIAAHHQIFTGVLASDGSHNLAGDNKYQAFIQQFGEQFSYIGNASPDLPILTRCIEPMVANPTSSLSAGLRSAHITPAHLFMDRANPAKAWLRAIRLHQWAKNVLIFLPLLLAHAWSVSHFAGSILAFLAFGLCASATYIVNDLLDLEADRRHHRKRRRPFAAGDLSAMSGCLIVVSFLAAAAALALLLPQVVGPFGSPLQHPFRFANWLLLYAVTTTAYSLKLKRVVLLDVIILSGLYTVRIIAGSGATGIEVSKWLAGFSIFFFLSLAFVKRFAELESLRLRGAAPANGRGYLISDIEQLRSFGTASAYASVVVLTLYISDLDTALYKHPGRLWLLVPVLLLWLSRLWLQASRGELDEDPVVYAITDKRSLLLGLAVVGIVVSAL
ncbi:UbiA family prenyltransferase [Granulicella tundricola]|uniref:UbiA prenyltransferase n=1 Tax=Granulicella tundricola (strain ATCC BAA-1859 / DSM 23138 / MP5ACTX9) TaxID=1198114 RepID=E8X7L3_GRATM|nr:UbiA family prenyltransferase [Granulicella tundricola]ADW71447.1 UbiA prenyltransferase [Granulicella tundricola MP5ACTX9]